LGWGASGNTLHLISFNYGKTTPFSLICNLYFILFFNSFFLLELQSLLIQGKGKFDCSKLATPSSNPTACNTTNPECLPYVMTVVPGKTYRLRISSVTALSALSFQIEVSFRHLRIIPLVSPFVFIASYNNLKVLKIKNLHCGLQKKVLNYAVMLYTRISIDKLSKY